MNARWKRQDTFNSDSGISMTSSPEVKLPHRRAEGEEVGNDDASSDSSDDASSEEDESHGQMVHTARPSSATELAALSPNRALPDTDLHVQRLQEQEAAMQHHMLHSPQPRRTIRPQVTSSHQPSPALPLYDRHATSTVPITYPFSPPAPGNSHGDPAYFQAYYHGHDPHLQPQFHFDVQNTTITGYEMLANRLSEKGKKNEASIKPLYRKFEHLNHRVLLHLQDEIAELEEELRVLDEMIAQTSEATHEDMPQPASRRGDAQYGSELHFKRTQVLGKIFLKLQQYSESQELMHL